MTGSRLFVEISRTSIANVKCVGQNSSRRKYVKFEEVSLDVIRNELVECSLAHLLSSHYKLKENFKL